MMGPLYAIGNLKYDIKEWTKDVRKCILGFCVIALCDAYDRHVHFTPTTP